MTSPYASFTRRAVARLIDLVAVLGTCALIYALNRVLNFPLKYTALFSWRDPASIGTFMSYNFPGLFLTFIAIKLLIAYLYFATFESSSWQATPGKLAVDIKVSDTDGQRISFTRATARYFLKSVSSTLLMIGYVVSFSDKRQTWHDLMSRSLVLRRKVFPAYYAMPRVSSRWIFSLPKFLGLEKFAAVNDVPVYECIACDHHGVQHIGCPNCHRFGYVSIGVCGDYS